MAGGRVAVHGDHGGRLGGILIMGVTDPLGGINSLFPLFGIANQLLAAIALAVCLAIAARRGTIRYLWIIILPLTFATVVTVTASLYKIFSPVPGIGYWAQNAAYRAALAEGRQSFGNAKTVEAMQAVVRNTYIQGTLSVLFLVLTLVVIATAVLATVRSIRGGGSPSAEDPPVPSRIYAPAGLVPTPAEKELVGRWDAAGLTPARRGHH
jgi:carbon starvation protein